MRALPLPTKQANAECFEPKDTEAEHMRCLEAEHMRCFTLLQFRCSPTSPSNAPRCDQVCLPGCAAYLVVQPPVQSKRAGDWDSEHCGDHYFASRDKCRKCHPQLAIPAQAGNEHHTTATVSPLPIYLHMCGSKLEGLRFRIAGSWPEV